MKKIKFLGLLVVLALVSVVAVVNVCSSIPTKKPAEEVVGKTVARVAVFKPVTVLAQTDETKITASADEVVLTETTEYDFAGQYEEADDNVSFNVRAEGKVLKISLDRNFVFEEKDETSAKVVKINKIAGTDEVVSVILVNCL